MALFGPRVGHDALFDEICSYHSIDRKVKTLLQTVIKHYQLPYPAAIFVDPDIMRRALGDTELADVNAGLQELYDAWFVETQRRR